MKQGFRPTMERLRALPAACRQHPKLMALLSAEVHELEDCIVGLRATKARQVTLIAQRQQATQDIHKLERQAQELAMRIRHAAQMFLGPRDPRLSEFHVKPLRPARRAARPQET